MYLPHALNSIQSTNHLLCNLNSHSFANPLSAFSTSLSKLKPSLHWVKPQVIRPIFFHAESFLNSNIDTIILPSLINFNFQKSHHLQKTTSSSTTHPRRHHSHLIKITWATIKEKPLLLPNHYLFMVFWSLLETPHCKHPMNTFLSARTIVAWSERLSPLQFLY